MIKFFGNGFWVHVFFLSGIFLGTRCFFLGTVFGYTFFFACGVFWSDSFGFRIGAWIGIFRRLGPWIKEFLFESVVGGATLPRCLAWRLLARGGVDPKVKHVVSWISTKRHGGTQIFWSMGGAGSYMGDSQSQKSVQMLQIKFLSFGQNQMKSNSNDRSFATEFCPDKKFGYVPLWQWPMNERWCR